jgi:cation diffusion facilitator family transporter
MRLRSAVGLAIVALMVLGESVLRLRSPVQIRFDEAITVAVIGLLVNLVSALLLREKHHHGEGLAHRHHDHNLRGAYLHVLADAFTSVLAIIALVTGKLLGWTWMDSAMGIVGGLIIARWSFGLLHATSRVLLDAEVPAKRQRQVREAIESEGDNRVADLHLWRVGPRHLAAVVTVVSHEPQPPEHYRNLLSGFTDLVHVTVEVHRCADPACIETGPPWDAEAQRGRMRPSSIS